MILNSRQSSFFINFPPDFFCKQIKEKYQPFFENLVLPYRNLDDFMASTIQSIDFPELKMQPVEQVRPGGKMQEYRNSKPIAELFTREFTITFKLTDAFLNYFVFVDNALNYYDFDNVEPTKTGNSLTEIKVKPKPIGPGEYFGPISLSFLSNEGYIVTTVVFDKPMITGWSPLKLSTSSNTPEFNTFSVNFKFYDMDIKASFK